MRCDLHALGTSHTRVSGDKGKPDKRTKVKSLKPSIGRPFIVKGHVTDARVYEFSLERPHGFVWKHPLPVYLTADSLRPFVCLRSSYVIQISSCSGNSARVVSFYFIFL